MKADIRRFLTRVAEMLRILPNRVEGAINLIIFKTHLGRLMKKFM